MNLREALNVLWRRRSLILIVAALGPLAVWMVGRPSGSADETHSASVRITGSTTANVSPIPQFAFIATDTIAIYDAVALDLEQATPDDALTSLEIQELIEVNPLPEINIMTISVSERPSAEEAELLVERFGFHLIQHVTEQRVSQIEDSEAALSAREELLRSEVASLNADLKSARARLTETDIQAGVSPDPVKEAELEVAISSLSQVLAERDALKLEGEGGEGGAVLRASPPNVTADPLASEPLAFNARLLLAAILGVAFGLGMAFALNRFDTRIYSRKDAETAFGLPVLAEVPRASWLHRRNWQLIARAQPEAAASEAYRLLRSSLAQAARLVPVRARRAGEEGGGTVVLVTSASEQVGKSTIVANLAVAAVDARKRVLVVGADLRRPTIHSFFGVVPGPGLTDAVDQIEEDGINGLELEDYLAPTSVLGTMLIRSGHPVRHPGERLALAIPLIEEARKKFDLIIIDTPAMLLGNDVNEVIPAVDLVLLVARAGNTTLEEAEWINETAERLQAPVCGVALVGSSSELQRRGRLASLFTRVKRQVSRRPLATDESYSPSADSTAERATPAPESPPAVDGPADSADEESSTNTPKPPPTAEAPGESEEEPAATTITMAAVPTQNGKGTSSQPEPQQPPSGVDAAIAEAASTLAAKSGNETQITGKPTSTAGPISTASHQPKDPVATEPPDDTGPLPMGQAKATPDKEANNQTLSASEFLAGLDLEPDPSPGDEQSWPPPTETSASFATQTVDPSASQRVAAAEPSIPGLGDPTLEFPRVEVEDGDWLRIVDKSLDLTLIDEDEDAPSMPNHSGDPKTNSGNGK